ncbi:hypothetical protein [Erythrobacter sp. HI0063]|jgi:hypothetical protein|uniref:hypothetical protein n=1 Tax=Erythrobacter sp. HI0063 TaxID=1822240 RepID=UPI000AF366CD|nr:hypothetical protein [Erythrobacter sp. HI0063]
MAGSDDAVSPRSVSISVSGGARQPESVTARTEQKILFVMQIQLFLRAARSA